MALLQGLGVSVGCRDNLWPIDRPGRSGSKKDVNGGSEQNQPGEDRHRDGDAFGRSIQYRVFIILV